MKATTDLFDLIQSLSPNEKRYFKRSATQHVIGDQNNYLRLFEAIARQKVYDEEALRKKFKGEKFIERLPSEKNYLFQIVLKSMRRYQSEKSVDIQLRDLMLDAGFLEGRGLYKASYKILQKAGKLAKQYERWPILIEILFREKDILVKSGPKNLEQKITSAITATQSALQAFTLQTENHDLYYQLFVQTRLYYQQRDESLKEAVQHLAAQANAGDGKDIPFFVQLKSHHIKALEAQLQGQALEAMQHFQAADLLWRGRPDLAKAHLGLRITNLANLISTCHFAGRYADMPVHLERLRAIKARTWDQEGERLQNIVFLEALHLISIGQMEGVVAREKEVLKLLSQFATKVNAARKRVLAYNLMSSFFLMGNARKTLEWADKLLFDFASVQRKDAQTVARLFQLILYYDRQDLDLVESHCRSIRRKLRRTDSLLPLEARILDFMQRWVDGRLPEQPYQWLLDRMRETEVSPSAPGKGELEIWCKAKMAGRPIKEVAKEILGKNGEA